MATTRTVLNVDSAQPVPGLVLPQFKQAGSGIGVSSYSFAASEAIQYTIPRLKNYGGGDVDVELVWYADTATSGDIEWGVSFAAITPNSDTTNSETKAFATEITVVDTAGGSTHQMMVAVVTITGASLDGLANDDYLVVKIRRVGSGMSGEGQLTGVALEYSD